MATTVLTKWEGALVEGFVFLPRALIRRQRELGLDATEMIVLLNLISSWWEKDDLPYPSPAVIAKRMDVSQRTVQRVLQQLVKREFISRVRAPAKDGSLVTKYDLSGTVGLVARSTVANDRAATLAPDGRLTLSAPIGSQRENSGPQSTTPSCDGVGSDTRKGVTSLGTS